MVFACVRRTHRRRGVVARGRADPEAAIRVICSPTSRSGRAAEDMRRLNRCPALQRHLDLRDDGGISWVWRWAWRADWRVARLCRDAGAAILGLLLGTAVAASLSLSSCRFSSSSTTRNRATWCSPCSRMVRSGRPLARSAAWRSGWGSEVGAVGKRSLDGGLAGAAAATIVYELVGALAFASGKTDHPAVVLDHDTRDGPIAGRDSVGGWGGLGLASSGNDSASPQCHPKRQLTPISITVGAHHLAAVACAERLVSQHVDRILDESDAAVGERKIAPAGVITAGIDETSCHPSAT